MLWVISVYFDVRNILPKSGTFPPGHSVYVTNGNPPPAKNEIKFSLRYGFGKNFSVVFYLVNDAAVMHITEMLNLLSSCHRYYYPV